MQGLEQKWAYEQALADFMKAKGGILVKEIGKKVPIKLILQDDESDPGKAAAAMERLIRVENVDFFLSTQYDLWCIHVQSSPRSIRNIIMLLFAGLKLGLGVNYLSGQPIFSVTLQSILRFRSRSSKPNYLRLKDRRG